MKKPIWVEVGMLGIKTRSAALSWFYLSIFGSVLMAVTTFVCFTGMLQTSIVAGIIVGILLGAIFSLSTLWYWLCIKWMDENGGWLK